MLKITSHQQPPAATSAPSAHQSTPPVTLRAERLKRDLAPIRGGFCGATIKQVCPLCPPPPVVRAVRPTPTAQGRGQSKACWDGRGGVRVVGWRLATLPLSACPDWGQRERLLRLRFMRTGVCGAGIECCRTDILLAHPALSSAAPPRPPQALRTRLIGTPNCPYEYFRGEQEWEFRVGGVWLQGP